MELFDNNSNKDEAAAAGLTALLMLAGFKGARNIPIAGAESVLSSLTKKGRLVRQLADNPGLGEIRTAYKESYKGALPSIFDSTRITNDAFRFPKGTPKSIRNDLRKEYNLALQNNDIPNIKKYEKEINRRGAWWEYAGDKAPTAAISRLDKGLKGDVVGLTKANRTTDIDLNDPQVLEEAMSNLSLSSKDAYDVITRAELLKRKRVLEGDLNKASGDNVSGFRKLLNKIKSQKQFKQEFRESVAVRPDIIDKLEEKAKYFSEKMGEPIEVARAKVFQAFSELSPKATATSNLIFLNEQIKNVINKRPPRRSAATQKKRAYNILSGSKDIYDDRTALDNAKKVVNLYEGLAESSSVPVLDTAVLRNILPSLSDSDIDKVMDRLYASPYVYKKLTEDIDELLSKGQVRKVSKNLVGKELTKRITGKKRKKISNFFLQGGIDMREGIAKGFDDEL